MENQFYIEHVILKCSIKIVRTLIHTDRTIELKLKRKTTLK